MVSPIRYEGVLNGVCANCHGEESEEKGDLTLVTHDGELGSRHSPIHAICLANLLSNQFTNCLYCTQPYAPHSLDVLASIRSLPPRENVPPRKKWSLQKICMAALVGLASVGVGAYYKTNQPVVEETAHDVLKREIGDPNSNIGKALAIFNETRGIGSHNQVQWNGTRDYIDDFSTDDLKENAMWGVDRFKRPFIALKYLCNKMKGVFTVFKRATKGDTMVGGLTYNEASIYCKEIQTLRVQPIFNTESFLGTLRELLDNKTVSGSIQLA